MTLLAARNFNKRLNSVYEQARFNELTKTPPTKIPTFLMKTLPANRLYHKTSDANNIPTTKSPNDCMNS
jgi:hypothetical protein